MINNKVKKIILSFVFILAATTAFAQPAEGPGDGDGSGDPLDPAPIADYILPMLVLGIATAYVLLRKKTTTQVS